MRQKIRKIFFELCEGLEYLMAVAALLGIAVAIIALVPQFEEFWHLRGQAGAFLEFFDSLFAIVIGIEFVKMLCKPNAANVIEVLVFLISRHMIIQETTALEDLLSVISICLLFSFQRFLKKDEKAEEKQEP